MARIWLPGVGYTETGSPYTREHEEATGMYGLEDYKRIWIPGKGYTDVSKKYPGGVPDRIGRSWVSIQPSAGSVQRALNSANPYTRAAAILVAGGASAISAGQAIRDPKVAAQILANNGAISRSYGGASSSLATGGSAIARGGPSVGRVPATTTTPRPPSASRITDSAGGIGGSIGNVGMGISDTITEYLPLAIKVGIGLIVVKIALSLLKGR